MHTRGKGAGLERRCPAPPKPGCPRTVDKRGPVVVQRPILVQGPSSCEHPHPRARPRPGAKAPAPGPKPLVQDPILVQRPSPSPWEALLSCEAPTSQAPLLVRAPTPSSCEATHTGATSVITNITFIPPLPPSLLLGDTDGAAPPSGGLGVLASHAQPWGGGGGVTRQEGHVTSVTSLPLCVPCPQIPPLHPQKCPSPPQVGGHTTRQRCQGPHPP